MKYNGCIVTFIMTILFYVLKTTISWLLWNNLYFIFNLPQLTWVQMAALIILVQNIFRNSININYGKRKKD